MNRMLKGLASAALSLSATVVMASPPVYLVTHNKTGLQSNAYVAGIIPSSVPTQPYSDGMVHWALVRMTCYGHITANRCPAVIKMGTNTPYPVDIGMVDMDIESGDIQPKFMSANGYTFIVNGPGEATLLKN